MKLNNLVKFYFLTIQEKIKMKKIATALFVTSMLSTACFAKGALVSPNACGYSDYFHLAVDSLSPLTIAGLTGDNNNIVVQKGNEAFYIKDAVTCPSDGGYAKVRYQKDEDDYCDLVIKDGANDFDPAINATCTGKLHYSGVKPDEEASSYSLSFYWG